MMSPTLTHAPKAPPRKVNVVAIAAAALVAVSSLIAVSLVRGEEFVDRVRVVNPSNLLIDVEVSDASRSGWLHMAIATPRGTTTTNEVIDQGDDWVFRFGAAGRNGGEIRVRRSDLGRSQWTMVIPGDVVERLRAAGARPAAPGGY
jgi:hypothetical protein